MPRLAALPVSGPTNASDSSVTSPPPSPPVSPLPPPSSSSSPHAVASIARPTRMPATFTNLLLRIVYFASPCPVTWVDVVGDLTHGSVPVQSARPAAADWRAMAADLLPLRERLHELGSVV